jgi:hypothetical protein
LPVQHLEKLLLPNGLGVGLDRFDTGSIPTLASNDLRKIGRFWREVKTDPRLLRLTEPKRGFDFLHPLH